MKNFQPLLFLLKKTDADNWICYITMSILAIVGMCGVGLQLKYAALEATRSRQEIIREAKKEEEPETEELPQRNPFRLSFSNPFATNNIDSSLAFQ